MLDLAPLPSAQAAPAPLPLAKSPSRRTTGDRLREAVLALGEHHGQLIAQSEKAWASITFAGARHGFSLLFSGAEAVAAGERLIDALPDHEFAIPGQLVADANVVEADHRLLPHPRLALRCELLLLEEG